MAFRALFVGPKGRRVEVEVDVCVGVLQLRAGAERGCPVPGARDVAGGGRLRGVRELGMPGSNARAGGGRGSGALLAQSVRLMGAFGWRDGQAAAYIRVRYFTRAAKERDPRRLAQLRAEFAHDYEAMRTHPPCEFGAKAHAVAWHTHLALRDGRAAAATWSGMRERNHLSPALYAAKIRAAVKAKAPFQHIVNIRMEMKALSTPIRETTEVHEAFFLSLAVLPDHPRAWGLLHHMIVVGGGRLFGRDVGQGLIALVAGGAPEDDALRCDADLHPLLRALQADARVRDGTGTDAPPAPPAVLDTAFAHFGILWTPPLYRALLHSAWCQARAARCTWVLRRMHRENMIPDAACYTELMRATAGGGRGDTGKLEVIFRHLKTRGTLTAAAYRVYMEACRRVHVADPGGDAGRHALKRGLTLLHSARTASLAYDANLYTSLAKMLAVAGYAGKALWLHKTAQLDAVSGLGVEYYKAVLTALVRGGQTAAARAVQAELEEAVARGRRRRWKPIGTTSMHTYPRKPRQG